MAQDESDERNISLTAHQPRHIMNGMIRINEPAKPSKVHRTSPSSSLGKMEALPVELIHAIFAMLDFKTLSDMTRTCSRGMTVVKSLPEYAELMQQAPHALAALGKTKLIRHHSAATVHAALLTPDCISCQRYGAFLFLPTCQRCCYHCLWKNQSLWVVPLSVAKRCFGLSAASAKALPMMRSLPGKYHVKYSISRQRSIGLVCVGAAKRLALRELESEEQMPQKLEGDLSAGCLSEKQYYQLRHLQRAPLSPPGPEFHMQPVESNSTNDMYCGMASIPFPYLTPDKRVERGLWCLGCEQVRRVWSSNETTLERLEDSLPSDCRASDMVNMMPDIVRLRDDFISHIETCPGAKKLMLFAGTHHPTVEDSAKRSE